MEIATDKEYSRLQEIIRPKERVLVAYSGGVDSALVLKASIDALGRDSVLAIIGSSPSVPEREIRFAEKLAEEMGASIRIVSTNEMESPGYANNGADRCYFCKTELYGVMDNIRKNEGYRAILNGANLDDMSDYRPGQRAAADWHVFSPLVDAELGKKNIRRIAHILNLSVWDKPASPCLSSRIPYFQQVTPEKLKMVERAEDYLFKKGFREFRVRCHEGFARIEIPVSDFGKIMDENTRSELVQVFREIGFSHCSLDMEGLSSGKFNEALRPEAQRNDSSF